MESSEIDSGFGDQSNQPGDEIQWLEYHMGCAADDMSLYSWMAHCGQPADDEQVIRGTLGRLLFSRHEIEKSVKVISGGEQGRMLFGKLMLQRPNIMLMDEPTNHLDMESIEALKQSRRDVGMQHTA